VPFFAAQSLLFLLPPRFGVNAFISLFLAEKHMDFEQIELLYTLILVAILWLLLAEKNSAPVPCAISLKIPALKSPALPMPMVYTFILLLFENGTLRGFIFKFQTF
jgi:hypothetical protein